MAVLLRGADLRRGDVLAAWVSPKDCGRVGGAA